MCGITAILSKTGRPIDRLELDALTTALAHRGPDGSNTVVSDNQTIGLGHTRLSILDPHARSNQPMTSASGRFEIVFNGEIYNFLELRSELETSGVRFRTDGDTEVFLEGFSVYREKFFEKMNGMWAALIWDRKERALTAVRDRFGVKPLYFYQNGGFTFFSSETLAFKALTNPPHLDEYELSIAIADPYYLEGAGRTIYRGVSSIRAGEFRTFKADKVETKEWWHLSNNRADVGSSYDERKEQFSALFSDACRIRMRSDVPIATALSGGLDSTCVLAACLEINRSSGSQERSVRVQSPYSIALTGSTEDESLYAIAAAKHLGSSTKLIEIDAVKAFATIEADVRHSDYIYISPDITHHLYGKMQDDGIKVSIDGHGADELFLGYTDVLNLFKDVDFERSYESSPRLETKRKYRSKREARRFLNRVMGFGQKVGVMRNRPLPWIFNTTSREPGWFAGTLGERAVLSDIYNYRLPSILRNFDKASMRHGVEIREPFLDYRLAQFAFSIPTSDKLGHPLGKRIIREVFKSRLAPEVNGRIRKVGINSPLDLALIENAEMVLDWMSSSRFLRSNIWDGHVVRQHFESSLKTNERPHSFRIWPILNAYLLGA